MKKTINVTQKCIDEGTRSNCQLCPVALAIKKIISFNFSVSSWDLNIFDTSAVVTLPLPGNAEDFIYDFDCSKKVKPFNFKLDIPERFLK